MFPCICAGSTCRPLLLCSLALFILLNNDDDEPAARLFLADEAQVEELERRFCEVVAALLRAGGRFLLVGAAAGKERRFLAGAEVVEE